MMNKIAGIFMLLSVLITSHDAIADCLACWNTQYVDIHLDDQQTISGFILWNNSWISYNQNQSYDDFTDYCDTLVEFYSSDGGQLLLIKYIDVFDHLLPRQPIAVHQVDTIDINHIHGIQKQFHAFNGLAGAGQIPFVSQFQQSLLANAPIDQIKVPGPALSDAYLFNYNSALRKEELALLSKELNVLDSLVIMIIIQYD